MLLLAINVTQGRRDLGRLARMNDIVVVVGLATARDHHRLTRRWCRHLPCVPLRRSRGPRRTGPARRVTGNDRRMACAPARPAVRARPGAQPALLPARRDRRAGARRRSCIATDRPRRRTAIAWADVVRPSWRPSWRSWRVAPRPRRAWVPSDRLSGWRAIDAGLTLRPAGVGRSRAASRPTSDASDRRRCRPLALPVSSHRGVRDRS